MDISALSNLSTPYFSEQAVKMDQEKLTAETFESALKAASENGDDAEIMKACEDFEAYFLNVMFKQMRKTINGAEKSNSQRIFEDMLDDEYSKKAAAQGGISLASFMFRQIKREQGTENFMG